MATSLATERPASARSLRAPPRRVLHVALGAALVLPRRIGATWFGRAGAEALARARDRMHAAIDASPRLQRWEAGGTHIETSLQRTGKRWALWVVDAIVELLPYSEKTWLFVDDIVRHLIGNRDMRRVVDDVVGYLVNHPLVIALVREQGMDFTDEVVNAARDRLTEADRAVDRIAAAIRGSLRRNRELGTGAR
jgi:hypothetical protein